MALPDPLDDLGARNCPQCAEPMDAAGDVREIVLDHGTVVEGSAWWEYPRCGVVAVS